MAKKAVSASSKDEVFNIDRVRKLVELMKDNELSEVDLQAGDQRIKLRRGGEQVAVPVAQQYAPAPVAAAAPAASAPSETAASPAPAADNSILIKSPMVGTFYPKPNPEAQPYVSVGDMVSPDKVVCTIEAMKTFNEIPAGVSGKVVAVLVEDGEPVDVNKPLFKVEPS